jgi:hypothetical protein
MENLQRTRNTSHHYYANMLWSSYVILDV